MSTSKIEAELLKATAISPKKKNELRQTYLKRLMNWTYKLPDEAWESLSLKAQNWQNDAAEDNGNGKEITDFPDLVDEKLEAEVAEMRPDDPLPDKGEPPPQPTVKPSKDARKYTSACYAAKVIVVKKPSISVKELSEKLKARDFTISDVTIANLRSGIRDTLRVLNELKLGDFKLTE